MIKYFVASVATMFAKAIAVQSCKISDSGWAPTGCLVRWAGIWACLALAAYVISDGLAGLAHFVMRGMCFSSALIWLASGRHSLMSKCSGFMAELVWAKDQPTVSKYIIACLDNAETH